MREWCDEARLPAGQDPDVVGLGTLIACAGSACIAVVCLLIQYLFFYLRKSEDAQHSHGANPIDILVLGGLRKPLKYLGVKFDRLETTQKDERRWPAAFDKYVKAVGDVQLAIGFAVLVYGYITLAEHGLSMYQWWLIVGLVWYSVIANLATTSYLRTYFLKRDPGERWLRMIFLVCLIVALSFSMVPIYQLKERLINEHDEDTQRRILLATNVLCYVPGFGAKVDTPQFRSAVALIGIFVVLGLLIIGLLKLYERPSSIIFKWRDHYRGEMQHSFFGDGDHIITCIRCEQRHMLLIVRPVLAFWLILRIYADFLNSVLTEILFTAAMFTWVTIRFIDILRLGGRFEAYLQHWNFGQIVALAFFLAPLGSLLSCLLGSLKGLEFKIPFSRRSTFRTVTWLPSFTKRSQPEELPDNDVEPHSNQSRSPHDEGISELDGQEQPTVIKSTQERREGNGNLQNGGINPVRRTPGVGVGVDHYKVLLSPRFVIALPLVGFSNLLYLVLLLVLPRVPEYPSTSEVLWRTIFWYVVYQPLLLFAFFLAGMIVEERVTREERMRYAYQIIAAIAAVLSTAAIFDTLYGLGGIPMSYIGMGTLGLILLVYLLYGCVARPGPLAKGKARSRFIRDGDVEEARPLLSETRRRVLSEVRIFPVRRQKLWHGPSRRPSAARARRSYGTIE
ncbi:uncharacterized protein F4812DRAFT_461825 [Daldinia caldariorum]|uniref:uncharacterized protein n=1 Tax=Daldinia caldariorum TaxID=326644 RepID=UPI0020079541|nr:uncharacterized protein F4812DRAFT_461825 [Daldinia caldariorum]KAI1465511.1 hypothetical protein F4812DRAFT_461825 [Daldinia caldariorum]